MEHKPSRTRIYTAAGGAAASVGRRSAMTSLLLVCLVAGATGAAPGPVSGASRATHPGLPRSVPATFRSQRFELAPTTESAETTTDAGGEGAPTADAPYPPSGWRPAGEAFLLPDEQSPGANVSPRGAPGGAYGSPAAAETTTETPEELRVKSDRPVEVQKSVGAYFVLLPNGQLQRMEFVMENDLQQMRRTARLRRARAGPAALA